MLRYGANKWRDSADPMEILYDWVNKEGISEPKWTENNTIVTIGDKTYTLEDFGMSVYSISIVVQVKKIVPTTYVRMTVVV